jgi:hypothetical protein
MHLPAPPRGSQPPPAALPAPVLVGPLQGAEPLLCLPCPHLCRGYQGGLSGNRRLRLVRPRLRPAARSPSRFS